MRQSGLRRRISTLRDAVRTQLWPLPTLAVALAVAIGVGLPRLDAQLAGELPPALRSYLFGGGAGAARTVLDAVASSLITVTALTFSLTVVTCSWPVASSPPACCGPSPRTSSSSASWPCSLPPSPTP